MICLAYLLAGAAAGVVLGRVTKTDDTSTTRALLKSAVRSTMAAGKAIQFTVNVAGEELSDIIAEAQAEAGNAPKPATPAPAAKAEPAAAAAKAEPAAAAAKAEPAATPARVPGSPIPTT